MLAGVILALMLAAARPDTFYRRVAQRLSAHAEGQLGRANGAFRECMWGLLLIVIVLGGIYAGIFTPTEAAAVSAVYAFFIAVFVYATCQLKDVPKVLLGSANMSAMILYIITNAVLFSFLMANEKIPQQMAAWIIDRNFVDLDHFLLVVNMMLLLAGNVMDPSSIVLIMAPILFPVAVKLGIHPVHLGILMVVNTEVGHVPSAGRAQSLRRFRYRQDGYHASSPSRCGHGFGDAGIPRSRHLRAGNLALAAAHARHDLTGFAEPGQAVNAHYILVREAVLSNL